MRRQETTNELRRTGARQFRKRKRRHGPHFGAESIRYDYGTGYATSTMIEGDQYVGYAADGDPGTGTSDDAMINSGGQQILGYESNRPATGAMIESGGEQVLGLINGLGAGTSTTIETGAARYVDFSGGADIAGAARYWGKTRDAAVPLSA